MQEAAIVVHTNDAGSPDYFMPLTMEYVSQEGNWVGACLEIGASSFADELDEMKSRLFEAVDLQLSEMERLGFLEEFLQDHSVSAYPIPPLESAGKSRFTLVGSG